MPSGREMSWSAKAWGDSAMAMAGMNKQSNANDVERMDIKRVKPLRKSGAIFPIQNRDVGITYQEMSGSHFTCFIFVGRISWSVADWWQDLFEGYAIELP